MISLQPKSKQPVLAWEALEPTALASGARRLNPCELISISVLPPAELPTQGLRHNSLTKGWFEKKKPGSSNERGLSRRLLNCGIDWEIEAKRRAIFSDARPDCYPFSIGPTTVATSCNHSHRLQGPGRVISAGSVPTQNATNAAIVQRMMIVVSPPLCIVRCIILISLFSDTIRKYR